MDNTHEIIVGIDLGTTHSLIAWCDARGPQLIRDAAGEGRVPSVMTFGSDGRVTIGWEARAHAVEQPTSTVFSIKRLMGRGFDELATGGELAHLPYHVVQRAADTPGRDIAAVEVNGRMMTPPELSAIVLRELKARAEAQLKREVRKAVITVPAYFDDAQRQATRDAGRIAGLEVVRIVNEPTAAALAYGLGVRGKVEGPGARGADCGGVAEGERGRGGEGEKRGSGFGGQGSATAALDPEQRAAGFSPRGVNLLGNGTGCATALEIGGAKLPAAGESVVAVYDLGGGTFDVSILRVVDGVFEVLSTHGNTRLGGDDLDREIISLVQREVHAQFNVTIESPATRQALRSLAENIKIRLSTESSAAIEVDLGAGRTYRRTISRDEFEALVGPWVERTIESCKQALRDAKLTADQIDQVVMVGGSTRIPLVRRRVEEVFGRVPYTALNPDEVVALGAAVQAGILAGLRHDALLLDVIPLSLGIETMGGGMGKLILRNTRVPCQATERFSTFVDGQTAVKINVLQGERELATDCRSLGAFELRGIPAMPAGLPKILVAFLVDENGILNVSAREERSGQEAGIQVVPAHGLTADEVKRMELDSYAHAREDMTAHRLLDLRNQVTFDTHKAEQMLAKVGDGIDAGERAAIRAAMQALHELAATTRDADALWDALRAFDQRTIRLAEKAISISLREA